MTVVLLPGMDGSGGLFGPFVAELPRGVEVVTVKYPTSEELVRVWRDCRWRSCFVFERRGVFCDGFSWTPKEIDYWETGRRGGLVESRSASRKSPLPDLIFFCSAFPGP